MKARKEWLATLGLAAIGILIVVSAVLMLPQTDPFQPAPPPPVDEGPPPWAGIRIADLSVNAREVLQTIPGVQLVTGNNVQQPKARIVHLLDSAFISRADFAAQRPDHSAKEVDELYQEFLGQLRKLQDQQAEVLTSLVVNHGVAEAWSSARSADESTHQAEMHLLKLAAERGKYTPEEEMLALKLGAASKVQRAGILKSVRPLTPPAGQPVFLSATDKSTVRHKTIVDMLLAKKAFTLIIACAEDDLTSSLPAGCEYLRVAVQAYPAGGWEGTKKRTIE